MTKQNGVISRSRTDALFDTNHLVIWNGLVCLVDSFRYPDAVKRPEYTIKIAPYRWRDRVPEDELSPMTWWRFCWFLNPVDGGYNVGKTDAWMAIAIHIFTAVLCTTMYLTDLAWWSLIPLIIVVAFWLRTARDYTHSWV